jgi:hypothetical chaperone protein
VLRTTAPNAAQRGEAQSSEVQILASAGVLMGGDDLDSAIMAGKVAPYFGRKSAIDTNFDGRPILFPDPMAELLEQWQTIPILTRPQYLSVIQRGIEYSDNRRAFIALERLATQNYGFALFQAIERAKCDLSQQQQTEITLQMGGQMEEQMEEIKLNIDLSRDEFNTLISQQRSQARTAIREVIAAAGLKAGDIDVIVATGGSSSIPAFQSLLKAELPNAEMIVSDVFGSVTGGLAIHAHHLQSSAISLT